MLYTVTLILPYTGMARIVLSDMDSHAMWALTGITTWLIACGLRFHTNMSKYCAWIIALCGGSMFAQSLRFIFSAQTEKCFAIIFMTVVLAFDLSAIPAAFLSCMSAADAESQSQKAASQPTIVDKSSVMQNAVKTSIRTAAPAGA